MAGLDNVKLKALLTDVASGSLQLPDFQRDWKWDDDRIRAIVATVTLDYPLGVVMTLETGGDSPFRARALTGAQVAEEVAPSLLLLDGQQRLTSLFQALFQDSPVETTDARGNPVRRWYYVDIKNAIGSPADRDEAIVSVPEDKVQRSNFARSVVHDLTTAEGECAAGLFPLSIVFDTAKVNAWRRAYEKMDDGHFDRWSRFEEQVLEPVRSFQVPMIKLAASTSMDAVCAVFERVNTGGVPLNVFELLTATYAGDRAYRERTGDYYQLPQVWRAIKEDLAGRHPVFGRLEAGIDDGLSSSDFLQAVALVRTWSRKQDGLGTGVSCKRRDLLELPLADFESLAPRLAQAFTWAGAFLERQCIVRAAELPYRTQLVPLAAVRAILGEATDRLGAEDMITQWYWCGVLGEMYGGSTETRFTRDVEQLVAWVRREGPAPETVTDAYFFPERLDTLTTRNSAAYKGIYALLIKQGAVDWHYTGAPLKPSLMDEYGVDVRHIFPRAWVRRNRDGAKIPPANSIVNKTPLSLRAAQALTGAPGSYLDSLAAASDMRREWFDDVIATHLIDPYFLRNNDYEAFYAARAKQLEDMVYAAMGKRTILRDMTDGKAVK
ncbi:GmrSD restriction endonuclease domain-containing protein [Streptomyces globosus]|uniref:GmrSD restriction endonuclease domain-containing protein n=2 Tax=Streptomyces globosus TaxID=68209 RepID=UPI0031E1662A